MKVVAPTHLLREAAAILEPAGDDVVVIGGAMPGFLPTAGADSNPDRRIMRSIS